MKKGSMFFLIIFMVVLLIGCKHDNDSDASIVDEPVDTTISPDKETKIDESAESLALEIMGKISIEVADYKQISDELIVLKSSYPEIANTFAQPSWALDRIEVKLEPSAHEDYQSGNYTAWDFLNEKYNLTSISNILLPSAWYVLYFDGNYNTQLLSAEYRNVPGILFVSPSYIAGDGSDICLETGSNENFYIFDLASGDCLSGCISHTYHSYYIDKGFNSEKVGTYVKYADTIPIWFLEHTECTIYL